VNPDAYSQELERAIRSHLFAGEEIRFLVAFHSEGSSLFSQMGGFFDAHREGLRNEGPTAVAVTSKRIIQAKVRKNHLSDGAQMLTIPWIEIDQVRITLSDYHVSLQIQLKGKPPLNLEADRKYGKAFRELHDHIEACLRIVKSESSKSFGRDEMSTCLEQMYRARLVTETEYNAIKMRLARS